MAKIFLLSLKEGKIAHKSQKMPFEGGKNHEISNDSSNMSIWSLKIGQTWKQIGTNILEYISSIL